MIRIVAGILLIIGIAGGTLIGSKPDVMPTERGGYKVVEADFHVHAFSGDGQLSPFGIVSHARHKGLHALAITGHNQIFTGKVGRWFSHLTGGPTVLVGEEITAPGFHIIGVGLNERINWNQSAAAVIEEIHRQGGVAIAAHPTQKFWPALDEVIDKLDGTEVMHQLAYAPGRRWEEMRDFYQRTEASGRHLTAIGSSDYHWFNSLGICRTYVFVHNNDEAGILDALRTGRTVVYDREGNAYGNPELIRLLTERPVESDLEKYDYDYSGLGAFDLISRACGWCGLMLVVLFGQKKRIKNSDASHWERGRLARF